MTNPLSCLQPLIERIRFGFARSMAVEDITYHSVLHSVTYSTDPFRICSVSGIRMRDLSVLSSAICSHRHLLLCQWHSGTCPIPLSRPQLFFGRMRLGYSFDLWLVKT